MDDMDAWDDGIGQVEGKIKHVSMTREYVYKKNDDESADLDSVFVYVLSINDG